MHITHMINFEDGDDFFISNQTWIPTLLQGKSCLHGFSFLHRLTRHLCV